MASVLTKGRVSFLWTDSKTCTLNSFSGMIMVQDEFMFILELNVPFSWNYELEMSSKWMPKFISAC
jgi:hypothetical protein